MSPKQRSVLEMYVLRLALETCADQSYARKFCEAMVRDVERAEDMTPDEIIMVARSPL